MDTDDYISDISEDDYDEDNSKPSPPVSKRKSIGRQILMLVPYKTIYAPVVSYDTLRTYLSIATATDIPSSAEHTSSAGAVHYTREASL